MHLKLAIAKLSSRKTGIILAPLAVSTLVIIVTTTVTASVILSIMPIVMLSRVILFLFSHFYLSFVEGGVTLVQGCVRVDFSVVLSSGLRYFFSLTCKVTHSLKGPVSTDGFTP